MENVLESNVLALVHKFRKYKNDSAISSYLRSLWKGNLVGEILEEIADQGVSDEGVFETLLARSPLSLRWIEFYVNIWCAQFARYR